MPAKLNIGITPTVLLGLLHHYKETKHEIRDGVLIVDGEFVSFRIDVATGKLLECWQPMGDDPQDRITIAMIRPAGRSIGPQPKKRSVNT